MLWAVVMGPPTLTVALLGNRAWRAVGLFALFLGVVLSGSYQLGFQALGCLTLSTRSSVLLAGFHYLLWAFVLACFALAAWLLARIVRQYQARSTSDQMLALDGLWLLVTVFVILFQLGPSGLSAFAFLLAFAAYKAALWVALPRLAYPAAAEPPQPLLLLRVFGYTRRTRTLIDQVGQVWRHNGPIDMIGGTDLAAALIEPDELAQFWTGRLRRSFIADADDLRLRMQALDDRRDPDGRYRINEFFCHDNTWQATVRTLARRSRAVLMDLRGFGRQNRGCEFELGLLLHEVPLARIVLLIDASTRRADLEALLQSVWSRLPEVSPNRKLQRPALQLLQAGEESGTLERLMSRLFASAGDS
jgi:multisubunit Na+/H+ antiporter MnhF subunit